MTAACWCSTSTDASVVSAYAVSHCACEVRYLLLGRTSRTCAFPSRHTLGRWQTKWRRLLARDLVVAALHRGLAARRERIARSSPTSPCATRALARSPRLQRLYDRPCRRAAALMRVICTAIDAGAVACMASGAGARACMAIDRRAVRRAAGRDSAGASRRLPPNLGCSRRRRLRAVAARKNIASASANPRMVA
jgi:hypothetical protein